MLRYANWTRLATWSGKHDYRPEERGGSPVEKGAGFRMTYASVGGLSHCEKTRRREWVQRLGGAKIKFQIEFELNNSAALLSALRFVWLA